MLNDELIELINQPTYHGVIPPADAVISTLIVPPISLPTQPPEGHDIACEVLAKCDIRKYHDARALWSVNADVNFAVSLDRHLHLSSEYKIASWCVSVISEP